MTQIKRKAMDEFKKRLPSGANAPGSLACGTFWKSFFTTPSRRLGLDPGTPGTRKNQDDAKVSKSQNQVNRKIM
jgi:hypothetical protein